MTGQHDEIYNLDMLQGLGRALGQQDITDYVDITTRSPLHARLLSDLKSRTADYTRVLEETDILAGSFVAHSALSTLAADGWCKKPTWEPHDVDIWRFAENGISFAEISSGGYDEDAMCDNVTWVVVPGNSIICNIIRTPLAKDCRSLLASFDYPCVQAAYRDGIFTLSRAALYSFLTGVNIVVDPVRLRGTVTLVYRWSEEGTRQAQHEQSRAHPDDFEASHEEDRIYHYDISVPLYGYSENVRITVDRADHFWYILGRVTEARCLHSALCERKLSEHEVERILLESGVRDDIVYDIVDHYAYDDEERWGHGLYSSVADVVSRNRLINDIARTLMRALRRVRRFERYRDRGFTAATAEDVVAATVIQRWWRVLLYEPGRGTVYHATENHFISMKETLC
jgi:hypothetical protein